MGLVETINAHWSWAGLTAVRVEAHNAFGNLIVEDPAFRFWRICPEELSAEIIAASRDALIALRRSPEFDADWSMYNLASAAAAQLGTPDQHVVFHFAIPAVLGGAYEVGNIRLIAFEQLVAVSGDLGRQIHDLPDGAQVKLIVDR
jgi:hypothetical protein